MFAAIMEAHKAAVAGRTCTYCGERKATMVDVFMDAVCTECNEAERREMKAAELRANELYFTTDEGK